MVNRGGFGFVAMLVINPIVILFYQNCSIVTVSHAKFQSEAPALREIASERPLRAEISGPCNEHKVSCKKIE